MGLCLALAVGFAALGAWQVERLHWKRDLIVTVETRLGRAPVEAPTGPVWSADDAYTRVAAEGVFRHDREVLVQAVTEYGPGFWVMTPLATNEGVILINRGFIPPERRHPSTRLEGQTTGRVRVTGLLRASEPDGGFLRANAPEEGRWYSRDVPAIAEDRALDGRVAPYFIDADATPNPGGYPLGGLTVVRFRNSHFSYALTWFGLSILSLLGGAIVLRNRRGPGVAEARHDS